MKFLIATEPDDYHALLVKRGLEEAGHCVRLWFIADQPSEQKNAVFIDNHTYQWISTDSQGSIADNTYDVIWWRRVRKPYLPTNLLHPQDHPIAVRENNLFYESLANNLAPRAWWVNSKEAASKSSSKLFQLKKAVDCGMTIPPTLCSNDPQSIRHFIQTYEAEGIVYKPLSINLWNEENQLKIAYTTKINAVDLPQIIYYSLFQDYINKR